jgi:hypothetical protein
MLGCESVTIIQAKSASEARKRAQAALQYATVNVDHSFSWDRGGIFGVSKPLSVRVVDLSESPDGLLNLSGEGVVR